MLQLTADRDRDMEAARPRMLSRLLLAAREQEITVRTQRRSSAGH
jgi:hypothetical protein